MKVFSFRTYWAMRAEREETRLTTFLWSFVYAASLITLFFLLITPVQSAIVTQPKPIFLAAVVLCLFRILYFYLATLCSYPQYLKWINKMPFTVSGWDKLFGPHFLDHEKWIQLTTVQIISKPGSAAQKTALQQTLKNFCRQANRTQERYYTDGLVPWKTEANSISGSCNCKITGKIYRFLNKDLKRFHHQHRIIDKIKIRSDNKTLEVSALETDNTAAAT